MTNQSHTVQSEPNSLLCWKEPTKFSCCALPSRSKAIVTLVTSLLLSLTVAGLTYGLSHSFTYSAVAGSSMLLLGCAVGGILFYCFYHPHKPLPPASHENQEIKTTKEIKNAKPNELGIFPVDFNLIQNLAQGHIDTNILQTSILWDTQLNREMPRIEVLQRALLFPHVDPAIQSKLIFLFAKEIIEIDSKRLSEQGYDTVVMVRPLVKYFSISVLKELASLELLKKEGSLSLYNFFDYLDLVLNRNPKMPLDPVLKKTIPLTRKVNEKLNELYPHSNLVLGLAADGGFCFYHAIAQTLSLALNKKITTAEIGATLLSYLSQNPANELIENECQLATLNGYATYENYLEHLKRLANGEMESATWGTHFISGMLVSLLYEVKIDVISADFAQIKKKNEYVDDLENVLIQAVKFSNPENGNYTKTVILALFGNHYLPVFPQNSN